MHATYAVLLGTLISAQSPLVFDFTRHDPIEFLDYLRANAGSESVYTVREPMRDWVRAEHVPLLMRRLDSKELALPVVLEANSHLPKRSTVGHEAAFLIDGYRQHKYPPALSSADASDKAEIRKWWNREHKRLEQSLGR
jgi:hypothetical protein